MAVPIPFSISDIEKALSVNALTESKTKDRLFAGVSTDSRSITKNDLFVALKGERFDGADYISELMAKEIKGFVAHKGFFEKLPERIKNNLESEGNDISIFETDNTLLALGSLARFQRLRSKAKIIAITGSSGKTTTRKLIGGILKESFNILATRGNLNNEIGLPLTLLRLSADHEIAVVEMGMNQKGEILRLSAIAQPDIGIITNTSAAHLEGLGSADNVALAKSEMFQNMNQNSVAVLNLDDPRYEIMKSKASENPSIQSILSFGMSNDADFFADCIIHDQGRTQFTLTSDKTGRIDVSLNSPAPFMIANSLAASAVALNAGAAPEDIKKGLGRFTPVNGRMNIIKFSDKCTLIDDTYNANPDSVKNALITLALVAGKNTSIAVLGDMLELGKESTALHKEVGKCAAENKITKLYTHGELSSQIVTGAVESGFKKENTMQGTREEIAEKIINQNNSAPSWVLVKGSRGMKMERVIEKMQELKNMKMGKSA